MQDFKMSGSNMNELLTNMKAIKERIDDSYDELTRLMLRIESDELWKGKEKTTFMAYMGLMNFRSIRIWRTCNEIYRA